ncbi:MAG: hypothetical protein V1495_06515 [Pseudomonadota bacterium]
MPCSFARRFSVSLLLPIVAACGAAATLPPQNDPAGFSDRLTEAVWYAENGDHPNLASLTDTGSTILVVPPGDGSTYVNGVFTVDVPDQDSVAFSARVGLVPGSTAAVRFTAYVQDGSTFPQLADVVAAPGGEPNDFTVDLSAFRGRAVLLILAVSSPGHSALSSSALWIDPRIVTP